LSETEVEIVKLIGWTKFQKDQLDKINSNWVHEGTIIKGQKKQSSKGSAVETILNVGSGYFIAMALNLYFLPHFINGIVEQSILIAAMIGLVYTITSMIRSFVFRRLFNKMTGKRKWL